LKVLKITPLNPLPKITPLAEQKGAYDAAVSFSQALREALGEVNRLQVEADQAARKLVTGEIKDLSEVTVAAEKANLALQLTIQVRNKAIEAYQEIMRMQV
jgi:flagellar hook-basal body complex protein FliE